MSVIGGEPDSPVASLNRRDCTEAEHPLCADTVERLSSGRSIEFVAPLLDPIRSDVEDPTSTHTETTKGLPTDPGLACSEKIQEGLLGA